MTRAGADILVAHMGLTTKGSIGAKSAKTLEECVALIDQIAADVNRRPQSAALVRRGFERHRRHFLDLVFLHHSMQADAAEDERVADAKCAVLNQDRGDRAAAAIELGLDHLEVIKRNLVPAAKFPYRAAAGSLYDSGDYPRAVETAIGDGRLADLKKRRDAARAKRSTPLWMDSTRRSLLGQALL